MHINSMEKRKQSATINYLRAIAMILVVIHHAMSYANPTLSSGGGGKEGAYYEFVFAISSVHVPLFFMISGYLCHKQNVPNYYKKKTFQILIPFLVFTSAKLVFNLFFDQFNHSGSLGKEFLKAYVFGEYYWFSYALLIMFFLAPLLWKLKNKFILIGVFCLLLAFNIVNGFLYFFPTRSPLQLHNVLTYAPWFLFGYVLNQLGAEKLLDKKPIKHAAFPLSVALSALVIFLHATKLLNPFVCKVILSFSVSYIFLYVFSTIPFKLIPLNYVSKYSYQIFLLDSFVKVILFTVVSKLFTLNVPIILLLALVNVAISTAISWIAHKIKFIRTLFGLS